MTKPKVKSVMPNGRIEYDLTEVIDDYLKNRKLLDCVNPACNHSRDEHIFLVGRTYGKCLANRCKCRKYRGKE